MTTSGDWNSLLVESYNRVAERYAEHFFHELDRKPFDRDLLDRYAGTVRGRGRVCDLGCGVGHIARYLHGQGVEIFGLDISPRMIETATRWNPGILFQQGDLLRPSLSESSLAGIVAFFSLIHVSRSALQRVLTEWRQTLIPGGQLLLAVHSGDGELHADEFLGHQVSLNATLFQPQEMTKCLERAGFLVDELHTREPHSFDLQTQRLYVIATKPCEHSY